MSEIIQQMTRNRQLSAIDAEKALGHFAEHPDSLSEALVLQWLADQYHLDFRDLENWEFDSKLAAKFPARILLKHELLPLKRNGNAVEMATARLFDSLGFDTLKMLTGEALIPVLVPGEAIRREIKSRLGVGADTLDSLNDSSFLQVVQHEAESVDLDDSAQDASIIRFVNQILADAIAQRATDIHLEPFENELRVRHRIDGVLQDVPVPARLKRFQPAIVSRVKILSELDIAEKRVPQDGRIKIRTAQFDVDVRVSVIPMIHGEAVVMRLLRQNNSQCGLDELQMSPENLKTMRRLLKLPHGIILVTGPTGSGKTTTLYAALQEINDSERKIVTIEDPVEYQITGINQIQVSEKSGMTFARGLRSILRHDPDVILVGEIRDKETAQIAVQASLTGHLVFSTLHTNDSPSALMRLVDMGIEPYLVVSSVEAILAQRLVRVLCPACKRQSTGLETVSSLAAQHSDVPVFYEPVGCPHCRHTGFHGRRAIFEMLPVNDELRRVMLKTNSVEEIRQVASRHGWQPLSEDGWRVIREGDTTIDEVMRVAKAVEIPGGAN
jgi:general secretion pathway protein E/type IV pilus assembly protein PilB